MELRPTALITLPENAPTGRSNWQMPMRAERQKCLEIRNLRVLHVRPPIMLRYHQFVQMRDVLVAHAAKEVFHPKPVFSVRGNSCQESAPGNRYSGRLSEIRAA